jgi:hypothetical protein
MTRYFPLLSIPVLVGVPLLAEPSWPIAGIGAATALFCTLGVVLASARLARTGAMLALFDLTVALWWSAPPMRVATALVFGLALLSLIEGVDFSRRFSGAVVDGAVITAQLRYWGARTAAIAAAAALLLAAARLVATALPPLTGPVIAGIGAITAFAAGVFACVRRQR